MLRRGFGFAAALQLSSVRHSILSLCVCSFGFAWTSTEFKIGASSACQTLCCLRLRRQEVAGLGSYHRECFGGADAVHHHSSPRQRQENFSRKISYPRMVLSRSEVE